MNDMMPHRNLYTRLMVSNHGVGVFAIRHIPEGLRLFEGDVGAVGRVPKEDVEQIEDPEVRRMYFDFCPSRDGAFIAPVDFNQLTMSWYMNHSEDPNVQVNEEIQFTSCREIRAGEELTINYTKFSDHAGANVALWNSCEKT